MPPIVNPENAAEPGGSAAVSRPDGMAAPFGRTRGRMDDDWSHVLLCIALSASFALLGYWKTDLRGFAAAGLFALLAVVLITMNLAQSRR